VKIIDCIQGEPEWHAARCGRVTGSRIADIVRKTKTGESKMRATYMGELVAERLAGIQPSDGYVSQAMQWGKDCEDKARATYAFMYDAEVVQVGFVVHSSIEMAGASPDSLVGDAGGLEAKCPNSSTHLEALLGGDIPPDYIKQMQWNMACTGRAWWDYVSFDPRLPPAMQLHVRRIKRDDALIRELESAVVQFIREIDEKIAALNARFGLARAA
jgi:putative phage-type endonuclease